MWLEPPQWLETVLLLTFILGVLPIAVLVSTRLDKYEEQQFLFRFTLSKSELDPLDRWKQSSNLATMIKNATANEVSRLDLATRKVFGSFVAASEVLPNGETWERKLARVGLMLLTTGDYDSRPRFNVILYRRDLASANKIRRPWRQAPERKSAIQLMGPHKTFQLPDWI